MNLNIRKATIEDSNLILDFIIQLAQYEKLEHEVVATVETIKETLFCSQPAAEVVIGYADKTPVGFALFFTNYSTFLAKAGIHLEDLFVLESERGKGYGKQLLTYLAQLAVSRNCGRLEWSVLDWNTPAIDFYKSLGAKLMEEWSTFRLAGEALTQLGHES